MAVAYYLGTHYQILFQLPYKRGMEVLLRFIIASVDSNNNLGLIKDISDDSAVHRIWIAAFNNTSLVKLTFEDYEQSGGQPSSLLKYEYSAQFPFSWIIIPQIEYLCSTKSGSKFMYLMNVLCCYHTVCAGGLSEVEEIVTVISSHGISRVLEVVDTDSEEEIRSLANKYLHDYTQEVCFPKCKDSSFLQVGNVTI